MVIGSSAVLVTLPACRSVGMRGRDEQVRRHVDRGEALFEQNDLDQALVAFEQAAALDPDRPEVQSRIGTIYRKMGDFRRAITAFSKAVRRDPYSVYDLFNLAELYQLTNRLADAVQAYLATIDIAPDHYDARMGLGFCYQQLREIDLAVEQFEAAARIRPDDATAYVNLGVALDAQGKHYEAISAYNQALERDAHQPRVLVNRAHTYMNQRRFRSALADLEAAVEMAPKLAAAHEALGYCLFRMKRYIESQIAYTDALALDPRLAKAHVGLGSIKMIQYIKNKSRTDIRDAALEHWHRALEADPDQPRVRALIKKFSPDA